MIRLIFIGLVALFIYFVFQALKQPNTRSRKKITDTFRPKTKTKHDEATELEWDEDKGVYRPKNKDKSDH